MIQPRASTESINTLGASDLPLFCSGRTAIIVPFEPLYSHRVNCDRTKEVRYELGYNVQTPPVERAHLEIRY